MLVTMPITARAEMTNDGKVELYNVEKCMCPHASNTLYIVLADATEVSSMACLAFSVSTFLVMGII